jgi:hypothetical protein
MKKDHLVLLIALPAYSFLFFEQAAGINFLIFTVLLLVLLLIRQPLLVFSKSWVAVALGSLVASFNIVWQHTQLAIVAHVISMVVLAGLSLNPGSSFLIALLNSVYSFFGSILLKMAQLFGEEKPKAAHSRISSALTLKVVVPPLLTALFIFIYRQANPAFRSVTDHVFTGWISAEWFTFTLLGFLLLFGFFYQTAIDSLTEHDLLSHDQLRRKRSGIKRFFKLPALRTEYQLGWLSFALLNALLLFVNGIDFYYLLISKSLPEGVEYAGYVHQGVYALIFSIVLAIAVILYYFRGNLNFYRQNRLLKALAYVWILQNILLVATTAAKTSLYIAEYSLTHKRIGVYVYLLLTVTGLVITFIKIYGVKNNWFLFRKTTWAFYVVLVLATAVNWSRFITQYNLSHLTHFKEVDIAYLVGLPQTNTALLVDLLENTPQQLTEAQKTAILQKKNEFLERYSRRQWQSWNYDDSRTAKALEINK